MILELGIFASHIIWLIRTKKIRKQAKEQGRTFDDMALEHEQAGAPFEFAERKSRKRRRSCQKDAEDGTVVEARTGETLHSVAGGESSTDDSPEHGVGQAGNGSQEKGP